MHILTFHKAEHNNVLAHTQRCSRSLSRTGPALRHTTGDNTHTRPVKLIK